MSCLILSKRDMSCLILNKTLGRLGHREGAQQKESERAQNAAGGRNDSHHRDTLRERERETEREGVCVCE